MDWQAITIIGMFLASLLYIATLYHLAHGRERQAVELGARLVMEALTRDGRLMAVEQDSPPGEPVNIGEEEYTEQAEESTIPDVIVARNERMAKQIGDKILDDLMRHADVKKV